MSPSPRHRRTYAPLLEQVLPDDPPRSTVVYQPSRLEIQATGLVEDEPQGCASDLVIFPGTLTGRWWLEIWDIHVVVMILVLAYYEPYTFALYRVGQEPYLFVVLNKLLNVTFTVDMVFQFFIAWPRSEESMQKNLWESNPKELAKFYMSYPGSFGGKGGWFWLDLLTVVPGWLGSWMAADNIANPMLMVRVLRIFQSTRLMRLSKLNEHVHSKFGYHVLLVECIKFFFITTLTCHWMACLWLMVEGKVSHGIISYYTDDETWLSALISAKGDHCRSGEGEDRFCTYLIAFYWATMTLTSVGYGDITPQNRVEYGASVFCMLVVGYIWAYIVGSIVSILSSIDPEAQEFKHNLDELNHLMHRRGLPSELKRRLRHYMHETRHFSKLKTQRRLVERHLSNGLQREIAARSAEVSCIMKGVWWVRDLHEEAVLDIVRSLYPVAYGPAEHMNVRESMMLMQKGIAGVRGRVLARGDIWGHCDILLETPQLIDGSMPRTVSYVECLILTKRSLLEVCRVYPTADRRLRKAQIRTAVARAFCQAAFKVKRAARKAVTVARISEDVLMLNGETHHGDFSLTSFVNPGVKPINIDMAPPMERCDLHELRRLLMVVITNQETLETRLSELSEEVHNSTPAAGLTMSWRNPRRKDSQNKVEDRGGDASRSTTPQRRAS